MGCEHCMYQTLNPPWKMSPFWHPCSSSFPRLPSLPPVCPNGELNFPLFRFLQALLSPQNPIETHADRSLDKPRLGVRGPGRRFAGGVDGGVCRGAVGRVRQGTPVGGIHLHHHHGSRRRSKVTIISDLFSMEGKVGAFLQQAKTRRSLC